MNPDVFIQSKLDIHPHDSRKPPYNSWQALLRSDAARGLKPEDEVAQAELSRVASATLMLGTRCCSLSCFQGAIFQAQIGWRPHLSQLAS